MMSALLNQIKLIIWTLLVFLEYVFIIKVLKLKLVHCMYQLLISEYLYLLKLSNFFTYFDINYLSVHSLERGCCSR